VFTDLDGTLLDQATYSHAGAEGALDELRRRRIPLVACTSKTAAETRRLLERLRIEAPYIVEGGAGVYLPSRCFPGMELPGVPMGDGLRRLSLAVGHDEVLRGMDEIRRHTGGAVRGFHEMTPDEIARETGLPPELAALAKQRDFDEPFLLLREVPSWPAELGALAARRGLRLSRGGRFWHLHGATDKGSAVTQVTALYRRLWGDVRTIGAGDSAIDAPLLSAVDVPLILGTDPVLRERLPSATRAGCGPAAWGRAVLATLKSHFHDTFFMAGNHPQYGV
jgi:mannosyl-3-phosphoglycerate phosphatase